MQLWVPERSNRCCQGKAARKPHIQAEKPLEHEIGKEVEEEKKAPG